MEGVEGEYSVALAVRAVENPTAARRAEVLEEKMVARGTVSGVEFSLLGLK